jgi:hypothetical protein
VPHTYANRYHGVAARRTRYIEPVTKAPATANE